MKLKWSDLFAYGNIVHATIRRPGLRTPRRLADFGLPEDSSVEKSGYEGHWKIVPQDALREIDRIGRDVRNTVESYSVPFPLVPGGMFVPDTSIKELVSKLESLKKDHRAKVDMFIENYDKLREDQCPAIKKYVKLINPKMNARETIERVDGCAPPAEELKKKFDVSWSVFAVQAPVNKAVAKIIEEEGESVRKAIIELVDETKKPIIEEIDRLTRLIAKDRKTKLSIKSINFGLDICNRFDTKNVFGDPFIKKSIDRLRSLLKTMEAERKDGITEKTVRDLDDLQQEIQNSDTKKQVAIVVKKILGKRSGLL